MRDHHDPKFRVNRIPSAVASNKRNQPTHAAICTSKSGDCTGEVFNKHCLQLGIRHELSAANMPQQVRVSEPDATALARVIRRMLKGNVLPKTLWGELIFVAACLAKNAPHADLDMAIPYNNQ